MNLLKEIKSSEKLYWTLFGKIVKRSLTEGTRLERGTKISNIVLGALLWKVTEFFPDNKVWQDPSDVRT
eukprot:snap_masked-scaffold_43-processed-gene-1.65-mRNA-1 protein AED:1.00 eAED:1.00 QI:0/0/0/0/1/1/2/0/68